MKSARIRCNSGPYFPAFGLNTERYGVTPITDTFHALITIIKILIEVYKTFQNFSTQDVVEILENENL